MARNGQFFSFPQCLSASVPLCLFKKNQFPGTVSRILFWRAPRGTPAAHSFLCRRFLAKPKAALSVVRLTRDLWTGRLVPYLVLHRIGFVMPPLSPVKRWALTPPLHPYQRRLHAAGGLIFCDTFRQPACAGRPPFQRESCPMVSGLSSRHRRGAGERMNIPGNWTFDYAPKCPRKQGAIVADGVCYFRVF